MTQDSVPGEGYVRSSSLFNGYLRNPDATATSFDTEGFFRTGDRVSKKNGKIFVDGRIKVCFRESS